MESDDVCRRCGQSITLADDGAWEDHSGACGCGDGEHEPGLSRHDQLVRDTVDLSMDNQEAGAYIAAHLEADEREADEREAKHCVAAVTRANVNPFPYQLDDDQLVAQFDALRRLTCPTLVDLIDLRATVSTLIVRLAGDDEQTPRERF